MRKLLSIFFLLGLFLLLGATFLFQSKNASAAVTHIVISQVELRTSASTTDEFVELYNPTGSDVNLSHWRLIKKTSTGSPENLVASLSGTIKSHGYFLVGSPDYSGGTPKDESYSNTGANIAADNSVILFSDAGITTVDLVGMGTASSSESAATSNPANGGSVQRLLDETGGHGTDTDHNNLDFEVLTTATPRNSSMIISPTPTPSPSPTPTMTPTLTPSATPTPTLEISPTPSETPSPTPSETPTNTPTPTLEPTSTPTPTLTPSITPTPTPQIIFSSPNLVCTLFRKPIQFLNVTIFFPMISCTHP